MAVITRKNYMDNEVTYRQYYSQFVTEEIKNQVINQIGLKVILSSVDKYLNDIPLKKWDNLYLSLSSKDFKKYGDFYTLSGKVCIAKQAAKQIKIDNGQIVKNEEVEIKFESGEFHLQDVSRIGLSYTQACRVLNVYSKENAIKILQKYTDSKGYNDTVVNYRLL